MLIAYPCIEADAEERSVGNIQNGATVMRELLKKSRYLYFLCVQKYSRRFIKFRLNHWCQMEYPGDAFDYFLNSVSYLAVNGTVTSLPVFI